MRSESLGSDVVGKAPKGSMSYQQFKQVMAAQVTKDEEPSYRANFKPIDAYARVGFLTGIWSDNKHPISIHFDSPKYEFGTGYNGRQYDLHVPSFTKQFEGETDYTSFKLYRTGLWHEAQHMASTPEVSWSNLYDPRNPRTDSPLKSNLINIFEDIRIEDKAIRTEWKGMADRKRELYAWGRELRPDISSLHRPDERIMEAYTQSMLFPGIEIKGDNLNPGERDTLDKALKISKDTVEEVRYLDNEEAYDIERKASDEVIKALKMSPYFKPPDPKGDITDSLKDIKPDDIKKLRKQVEDITKKMEQERKKEINKQKSELEKKKEEIDKQKLSPEEKQEEKEDLQQKIDDLEDEKKGIEENQKEEQRQEQQKKQKGEKGEKDEPGDESEEDEDSEEGEPQEGGKAGRGMDGIGEGPITKKQMEEKELKEEFEKFKDAVEKMRDMDVSDRMNDVKGLTDMEPIDAIKDPPLLEGIKKSLKLWRAGYQEKERKSGGRFMVGRFIANNRKPFVAVREIKPQAKKVMILSDVSGSTSDYKNQYDKAIFSTMSGIDYMKGDTSLYAFGDELGRIKNFKEKWSPIVHGGRIANDLTRKLGGGTEIGFNNTSLEKYILKEKPDMIFVLSDSIFVAGMSVPKGKVAKYKRAGIKVFGIGIDCSDYYLKDMNYNNHYLINSDKLDKELPDIILDIVRGAKVNG